MWPVSKNPTRTVGFPLRHVAKAKDQNTPIQQRDGTGGPLYHRRDSRCSSLCSHTISRTLEHLASIFFQNSRLSSQYRRELFIDNTVGKPLLSVTPCVSDPVCYSRCDPACVTRSDPPEYAGVRSGTRSTPISLLTQARVLPRELHIEISVGLVASSSCSSLSFYPPQFSHHTVYGLTRDDDTRRRRLRFRENIRHSRSTKTDCVGQFLLSHIFPVRVDFPQ